MPGGHGKKTFPILLEVHIIIHYPNQVIAQVVFVSHGQRFLLIFVNQEAPMKVLWCDGFSICDSYFLLCMLSYATYKTSTPFSNEKKVRQVRAEGPLLTKIGYWIVVVSSVTHQSVSRIPISLSLPISGVTFLCDVWRDIYCQDHWSPHGPMSPTS